MLTCCRLLLPLQLLRLLRPCGCSVLRLLRRLLCDDDDDKTKENHHDDCNDFEIARIPAFNLSTGCNRTHPRMRAVCRPSQAQTIKSCKGSCSKASRNLESIFEIEINPFRV